MTFDDTEKNIPESEKTLYLQQMQLINGKRQAQMFPIGSQELTLPEGFARVQTSRGVFHFDPEMISGETIRKISEAHRENEILGLGPYSKDDIHSRVKAGENLFAVTELTPDGVEVKSAAATPSTVMDQLQVFGKLCLSNSSIQIEPINSVLDRRRRNGL